MSRVSKGCACTLWWLQEARHNILAIHTKEWKPKIPDWFLADLAERCEGYCGADLKALCTETAILAFARHFPQIYDAAAQLDINVNEIVISGADFTNAFGRIKPAQQRSGITHAFKTPRYIEPLVMRPLAELKDLVEQQIPAAYAARFQVMGNGFGVSDDPTDIYSTRRRTEAGGVAAFANNPFEQPPPHFARLLVSGSPGMSQTSYLCPALLSDLEKYPVHSLDPSVLAAMNAHRSLDEACVQTCREALRLTPSIIYLPRVDSWWDMVGPVVQTTIRLLIEGIKPSAEVFVLASSDCEYDHLPERLRQLFPIKEQRYLVPDTTAHERREFFSATLNSAKVAPISIQRTLRPRHEGVSTRGKRRREVAVIPQESLSRRLSTSELKGLQENEETTLRKLRMYLRNVLGSLLSDKKLKCFRELPTEDDAPDYADIIKHPECLTGMLDNLNDLKYESVETFLADIDLIHSNAYQYNPKDGVGRKIRNAASSLQDDALNHIENTKLEHEQLLKECSEIEQGRKRRKMAPKKVAAPPLTEQTDILLEPTEVS